MCKVLFTSPVADPISCSASIFLGLSYSEFSTNAIIKNSPHTISTNKTWKNMTDGAETKPASPISSLVEEAEAPPTLAGDFYDSYYQNFYTSQTLLPGHGTKDPCPVYSHW